MNRFRGLAALVFGGLVTLALSAVAALAASGPVLDVDFADPHVMLDDGVVYAYATNAQRGFGWLNVQVSQSSDGETWSKPVEAMPGVPAWSRREQPDIWAPEVMKIGGRYVLYFSARHATRRRPDGLTLCVGAAIADKPAGPFVPLAEPLTCGGEHGVIDASPFRDGKDLWLYVKTDGNCCRTPIQIRAQRLSPDGLSLVGEAVAVEGLTNDKPWEGGVIEAQQMVKHGGGYWMFYTGNDYGGGNYAMGYAQCDGPTGPCRDSARNPILKSDKGLVGPGHQSVFQVGEDTWIAFHGWRTAAGRPRYRALYLRQLTWTPEGPVILQP